MLSWKNTECKNWIKDQQTPGMRGIRSRTSKNLSRIISYQQLQWSPWLSWGRRECILRGLRQRASTADLLRNTDSMSIMQLTALHTVMLVRKVVDTGKPKYLASRLQFEEKNRNARQAWGGHCHSAILKHWKQDFYTEVQAEALHSSILFHTLLEIKWDSFKTEARKWIASNIRIRPWVAQKVK